MSDTTNISDLPTSNLNTNDTNNIILEKKEMKNIKINNPIQNATIEREKQIPPATNMVKQMS